MAKVIPIGQPVNDAERKAIGFLRDRLPDGWLVIHNFEMRKQNEVFEIDVAIIAPHVVYLVDIKGTKGNIDVIGPKWYPEGRQPFVSPLAKLRSHAKVMHNIICDSNPGQIELRKVYVHAVVLLTADDATLADRDGRDSPDVTDIKHCLKYFQDKTKIPAHFLDNILPYSSQVAKVITGRGKAKTSALVFREWQVEEKLGGTDRYSEYRAKHNLLGSSGGQARLRVYQADPYQDEDARKEELLRISNAYRAVAHMPSHANILAVRDFFPTEEEDRFVLVTEDAPGYVLRLHVIKPSLALTFDQKLQVMHGVLAALDHAHHYEVIHRNLTPDDILVSKGGQVRLTGFDFARVGKNRTETIAYQIVDDLEADYQAPECYKDPAQASIASDLYSAGLIFYELLTGEAPFESTDQMLEADGKFPLKPSELNSDLPKGIDEWLQLFCEFDPEDRHVSAAVADKALDAIILPEAVEGEAQPAGEAAAPSISPVLLANLPQDFLLQERFRVQKKLGSGGFGVTYKVFDVFGDVVRVMKLVTKDRLSVFQRMKKEYKALSSLPEHPHVVKVVYADRLTDTERTPFILFEYVDGLDVSDMMDAETLTLLDCVRIVRETAEGLAHLHKNGVFHQDIKPSNLLWTDDGVRIIDFNVSVTADETHVGGGGTKRYIPPDYDYTTEPQELDRIDRDIYALGITLYECLTAGKYPFSEINPPLNTPPRDIRQFRGGSELTQPFINFIEKLIAPNRTERFASTEEVLLALETIKQFRITTADSLGIDREQGGIFPGFGTGKKNFNPYVSYLLTLFSQSRVSNAGTRGLDAIGKETYIPTLLDKKLVPSLLAGEHRLVIISGNAGDGKTAFIQQFESVLESKGATMQRGVNGALFRLDEHTFLSNYDGSQDEGNEQNDEVLDKFFGLYSGDTSALWSDSQTRIIAINEGRLVDFLLEHSDKFPLLLKIVQSGLNTMPESLHGVMVINLNMRSVVADSENTASIMERMLQKMVQSEYWTACESCDLKGKCYIQHNVRTFQDEVIGAKVTERLKYLYSITHFRSRMHITMRDLRSALSFMLVGTKNCDEIHSMYQSGGEDVKHEILDSYYFNSWMGGSKPSQDRLIALLREIDMSDVSNPALDRDLGMFSPQLKKGNRFSFNLRDQYDDDIVDVLFRALPRDYSSGNRAFLMEKHHRYLSHLRRRHFFECRDGGEKIWMDMLPYKGVRQFADMVQTMAEGTSASAEQYILAINRGEGLTAPERLGKQLALRVRRVDKGTIRSYRLFSGSCFSLQRASKGGNAYLEHLPDSLLLTYQSEHGSASASLKINLDVHEMLTRLNSGYVPSVEEQEGFYLSLSVFKNMLAAAPYQEVLLTENGISFYRIQRDSEGVLHMESIERRGNQ